MVLYESGCQDAHSISGVCGCPRDVCQGEDVIFPDKEVLIALNIIDVVPTCHQMDAFATKSSKLRYLAYHVNYVCGCNGGFKNYLASSVQKRIRKGSR
jgi:hypothetical protein